MIDLAADQVWLAPGPTDMRKSIDTLAALVKHQLQREPTSRALFVFCSRGRDRIKALYWDHNGFWLLYKRLETGRFKWPADGSKPLCIDQRQLRWLLSGLEVDQRQAHRPVYATAVV